MYSTSGSKKLPHFLSWELSETSIVVTILYRAKPWQGLGFAPETDGCRQRWEFGARHLKVRLRCLSLPVREGLGEGQEGE